MLNIHTEFQPIWSSRRVAVASPDLEIIDGIYCIDIDIDIDELVADVNDQLYCFESQEGQMTIGRCI